MAEASELNAAFEIENALRFERGAGGLLCAQVNTPACTATVYLHGAHLTHWQPTGADPVLFLSEQSVFSKDKAIRGGVPVIFPWFGARQWAADGRPRTDGPQHGFARTAEWQVAFATLVGEDLHLTLTLHPDEGSRALGYGEFRLAYELVLGRSLRMRLTVGNTGSEPLKFEQALHTYLHVGDAERIQIAGLAGTEYLDKTDNFARKRQTDDPLTLHGETDRPYLNTAADAVVTDPVLQRTLRNSKRGSQTTVVWNPWSTLAAKLVDFGDDEWKRMVCVETANVAENAVLLPPQQVHVMEAELHVTDLAGA